MGRSLFIIMVVLFVSDIGTYKAVYGQATVDYETTVTSNETARDDKDQDSVRQDTRELDDVVNGIDSRLNSECNMTGLDKFEDRLSIGLNDTEANCNLPTNTTHCGDAGDLEDLDELVSKETSNTVRFVVNLILLPVIAIPGCVCNVFNIFILARKSVRSSTHSYLTGLSIADLLYLVSVALKWTFFMVEHFNKPLYLQIMMSIHTPLLDYYFMVVFGRTSNVLTLIISLERFVAVKFPLKAKLSPFSRHPIKIIVVIYVFVITALLPNIVKYKFAIEMERCSNSSSLVYGMSDLFWAHKDFFDRYLYFLLITLRFVPMIFVFLLNCGTIIILKLSHKSLAFGETSNEDVRQKEELKITRMLITIAAIFIVCVFPGFVHNLFEGFMPAYISGGRYQYLWTIFFTIFTLLDTVNATVNFIVYILMSNKFRSLCLKTICCKRISL